MKTADEEQRQALRQFGNVLLGGFRYDPILLALLRQFLSEEAMELLPDWMMEEKKEENAKPKDEAKPPDEPEGPPAAIEPPRFWRWPMKRSSRLSGIRASSS
jgi:hypothetical protein